MRALTNGDVLTVQQRQRFIDKITYDIIKAKGVPQPQQIQEIAMQVANMYPRSLVILPEGKRKSSLRKRGRGDDDDEDCEVKSSVPKRAKKEVRFILLVPKLLPTQLDSRRSDPITIHIGLNRVFIPLEPVEGRR